LEGAFGKLEARGHQRFARVHQRHGLGPGRNGGQRGYIAAAEVFGERSPNGAADFGGVKFHAHKMTRNPKRKSKKTNLTNILPREW
jgi:hypothetical protein